LSYRSYPVSEISYDIWREGSFVGYPAVFVRLHGCNLSCSYCDQPTNLPAPKQLTINQIVRAVMKYPARFVVITGGEPTLHDLNPLIRELKRCFRSECEVAVETNGYRIDNAKQATWITLSPKRDVIRVIKNLHTRVHEVRIPVQDGDNVADLARLARFLHVPIFLQPIGGMYRQDEANTRYAIEKVQKHPILQLSLQTHKQGGYPLC
jgi:organic radical activating enzyme